MGIAPRQIGWSNESNLLWNISKQLEKLNGVVAATAAGGMLNPTTNYIPFNSGLAFGDSYLVNDTTASVLKTVYSASDIGLRLDFAGNAFQIGNADQGLSIFLTTNRYNFGDFGSINNNTAFYIDDGINLIKTTNQGNDIGLKLDFANNEYIFGNDNGFSSPFNYLYIEPTYAEIAIGSGFGLNFNIGGIARRAIFGDPSGNYNSTQLYLDDTNQIIKTSTQGNDIGLKLDFANNIFQLGDFTFPFGVTVDFNNQFVSIGDYQAGGNGTAIVCDNTTAVVKTVYNTADKGLNLDFANGVYTLGNISNKSIRVEDFGTDVNINALNVVGDADGIAITMGTSNTVDLGFINSGNSTSLRIDDDTQKLIISSNLSANTAGASSGQFLKVTIGGVDYKIALLNN